MRRIATVAVAIGVFLAAALAVSIENAGELRADLRSVRERLARTETSLAVTAGARQQASRSLAKTARAAELGAKRIRRLADRLDTARTTLQRLSAVTRSLVPRNRSVFETRLLPGDPYDLLVVQWHEHDGGVTLTGLNVWRVPADDASSATDPARWELVYVAEPLPSYELDHASYVLHGDPASPTREEVDFIQMIDIADVGDATGDGLPDLAIQQYGQGSGGCGAVNLLQNLDGSLRETFRRADCIHGLAIERGGLVYTKSPHNSCRLTKNARCFSRTVWFRWTGSSWSVTAVEREPF